MTNLWCILGNMVLQYSTSHRLCRYFFLCHKETPHNSIKNVTTCLHAVIAVLPVGQHEKELRFWVSTLPMSGWQQFPVPNSVYHYLLLLAVQPRSIAGVNFEANACISAMSLSYWQHAGLNVLFAHASHVWGHCDRNAQMLSHVEFFIPHGLFL